jgi:hypothetical protein
MILKLNNFKDELSTKRVGYYQEVINLVSKEDKNEGKTGEPYTFIVYIKELDRYINGMSKVELTNLELISGFETDRFSWAAKCLINDTQS